MRVHLPYKQPLYRFGAGSVGPAAFGLGIKDSFIVIIVVDVMYVNSSQVYTQYSCPDRTCAVPAML